MAISPGPWKIRVRHLPEGVCGSGLLITDTYGNIVVDTGALDICPLSADNTALVASAAELAMTLVSVLRHFCNEHSLSFLDTTVLDNAWTVVRRIFGPCDELGMRTVTAIATDTVRVQKEITMQVPVFLSDEDTNERLRERAQEILATDGTSDETGWIFVSSDGIQITGRSEA